MLFENAPYLGIAIASGRRPYVYTALDGALRPVALQRGDLEAVLAFVGGQERAWIGIAAAPRPNLGLLKADTPLSGPQADMRLAEYRLRQRGLSAPRTPADVERCSRRQRLGFALHRALERLGTRPYPAGDAPRQSIEIHPQAAFQSLLGHKPYPKHALEGRMQRQSLLYEQGLEITDPMRFFEEITRFRLLQGTLPLDLILPPHALEALVSAYVAFLAATRPDEVILLGAPEEGQIALPETEHA